MARTISVRNCQQCPFMEWDNVDGPKCSLLERNVPANYLGIEHKHSVPSWCPLLKSKRIVQLHESVRAK